VKSRRHGIVAALLGFAMSLGLHAVTQQKDCPEGTCPVAAPTGVRGVVSTATAMQISWDDVPKAFAYRIQVAPQNNFLGDHVITVTKREPTTPKPLVIPKLDAGTTYHIRVSVVDRALTQQSRWSAPADYATKGPMSLAVGTYNVRNPLHDDWDERVPLVADGIVSEKLNVVGIQEVYRRWERRSLLDHLNAKAKAAFGVPAYAMTPGPYSDLGYDDRILYDTRYLQALHTGAKRYDFQVGDGDVDRWFSWATFKHRQSNWTFLFVTTHLAPDNDHADSRQWKELVEQVNALKAAHRVQWVVVAGDFNTTKLEKPADVMLPAMRANGYGDVLGQMYGSYETNGARAQVRKDAYLRSFNGFRRHIEDYSVDEDQNGDGVDWIFASNELGVPYYRVYARYDDGKLTKPIPSDHFLVHATLAYVPPQSKRSTVAVAKTVNPRSVD
jgi:endonuclease/exonuclease/phosphatase family metal-dependent hydrolase